MTPASLTGEILLCLTRGEPARQSQSRCVESAVGTGLSQMASHGVIGKLEENAHRVADLRGP